MSGYTVRYRAALSPETPYSGELYLLNEILPRRRIRRFLAECRLPLAAGVGYASRPHEIESVWRWEILLQERQK